MSSATVVRSVLSTDDPRPIVKIWTPAAAASDVSARVVRTLAVGHEDDDLIAAVDRVVRKLTERRSDPRAEVGYANVGDGVDSSDKRALVVGDATVVDRVDGSDKRTLVSS